MPAKTPKANVRSGGARKSTPVKATKVAKKRVVHVAAAKKATKGGTTAKSTRPPTKATKSASKKLTRASKAPAKKATRPSAATKATRPPLKAAKSAPKRAAAPAKAATRTRQVRAQAPAASKQLTRARGPKPAAPVVTKQAPVTAKPVAKAPVRPLRPEPKRLETGYTDEKFLGHQKAALERERATYVEQASSLQAEADLLIAEMEPGDIQFDEESGEGGTVAVDRERDLALSAQALEAVEEIDAALEKIASGKYGICENCGQLIAKARLEALPYARLCIACKSGGLSRR
jgi:DnaK suppressor protein